MKPLPTPSDLAERPELAALHVLESSLEVAEHALLAAHPDLEHADFFPLAPPLDSDAWIADSILTLISGIQTALQRYHAELYRQHKRSLAPSDDF